MANTQVIADRLNADYAWVKYNFGCEDRGHVWQFRYLIACILVGGSLETATLACAKELFNQYPDIKDLAKANKSDIAQLIEDSNVRFHGPKSKYVVETAKIINKLGYVPNNREDLEKLPGVGRHVASVVLATVFGQNEFAVDVHVRRIAVRLGIAEPKDSDLVIERKVVAVVRPEDLGHFSRAFVDFGQDVCAFTPNCHACKMTFACVNRDYTGEVAATAKTKAISNITTTLADGNYTVNGDTKTYSIVVKGGFAKCSCTAARYGKSCRHIAMAK